MPQKLFKGGNYSREETIRKNTVCTCKFMRCFFKLSPFKYQISFYICTSWKCRFMKKNAPWEIFWTHCVSTTASRAKGQDPYSICHFEEECLKKIWPKQKISMQPNMQLLMHQKIISKCSSGMNNFKNHNTLFGECRSTFVSL